MSLTSAEFWLQTNEALTIEDQRDHDVARFLDRHVDGGEGKVSVELGSFPGAFQPTLGRRGFTLHGVDLSPRNATDLPRALSASGFRVGAFVTDDIFDFARRHPQSFDLVCSFGLIEHFVDWQDALSAHLSLVRRGGQAIITAPNFRGWMQYWPHRLFDAENLRRHELTSMDPTRWRAVALDAGFDVSFAGYFGGYRFWVDGGEVRSPMERRLLRVTERAIAQARKLLRFESPAFSAYCGIVARRR